MASNHKSVVRNQGYTRAAIVHVERHNERKNENYSNLEVVPEQSINNRYYKVCDDTYLGTFDKMVKSGEISTRGLKLNNEGTKPESNIIAEMLFDVNTEYFENYYKSHGYDSAYEFAKVFYFDAYKMAVAEVGDEKYILSAVLHADERNKGLSEQLGRDVYHYHLHVTYIPVVEKEILWTKRAKPELVGKVKEVINQVNHSKKWESEKILGEDGKEKLIYSYSKLQDRYHDYMKNAGYHGFERGEKGSTAEHLSVLDYKAKVRQDELHQKEKELGITEKTLSQKSEKLSEANTQLSVIDKKISQKESRVEKLTEKEKGLKERIKSIEDDGQLLTLKQLEKIQSKPYAPVIGQRGVILSEQDEKSLRAMAMTSAKLTEENKMLKTSQRVAHETIRNIVQAVSLLKFQFTETNYPAAQNLTPEQNILIDSIRNHAKAFVKKYGYDKLADDMKLAKLDGDISEIFSELEEEQQRETRKNISAFSKRLDIAKAKVQEQNQQKNIPNRSSQGHNRNGDER